MKPDDIRERLSACGVKQFVGEIELMPFVDNVEFADKETPRLELWRKFFAEANRVPIAEIVEVEYDAKYVEFTDDPRMVPVVKAKWRGVL